MSSSYFTYSPPTPITLATYCGKPIAPIRAVHWEANGKHHLKVQGMHAEGASFSEAWSWWC